MTMGVIEWVRLCRQSPRCSGASPRRGCLLSCSIMCPSRGGSLVLSGEPGVGKSALLREASARAARSGMLVLTATGVQSEAQLPFAGLHQLLRPVLGQLDGLAAPQRDAILAAFGLADAVAPDLFLTALAALDLLAETAVRVAGRSWSLRMRTGSTGRPVRCWRSSRGGWSSSRSCCWPRSATATRAPSPTPGSRPCTWSRCQRRRRRRCWTAALLASRMRCATGCSTKRRATRWRWWNCRLPSAISASGARLPAWLPLTTRLERAFAAPGGRPARPRRAPRCWWPPSTTAAA